MNMSTLREALEEILKCDRIDVVKEIAADALDVDVNDYIDEDDAVEGSVYTLSEDDDFSTQPKDVLAQFE